MKIRPPLLICIHRSPLLTHIHGKDEISPDKDENPRMLNRPSLLTHINKKQKKSSMFTLECNTTNISPNNHNDSVSEEDEDEDWNLVINNAKGKKRVINNWDAHKDVERAWIWCWTKMPQVPTMVPRFTLNHETLTLYKKSCFFGR